MRTINTHKVNPVNDTIKITVLDEPGQGGANHKYCCQIYEAGPETHIEFQNGPIKEFGVNGLTHEVLLAIVIDRLKAFQAGPFACFENAMALSALEQSVAWLHKRTRDRMARGVEGTHNK